MSKKPFRTNNRTGKIGKSKFPSLEVGRGGGRAVVVVVLLVLVLLVLLSWLRRARSRRTESLVSLMKTEA
jgi:hypothetical protein